MSIATYLLSQAEFLSRREQPAAKATRISRRPAAAPPLPTPPANTAQVSGAAPAGAAASSSAAAKAADVRASQAGDADAQEETTGAA